MPAALLPTLLLGILLGMRHATDADHVVAVTTIVTRQGRLRDALRIGALWGIGHIPPRLGLSMEFAVALMLIGLGTYNLFADGARAPGMLTNVRPVLVGIVHGLAGSAAVALLVLATINDVRWAVGYLLLFGLGTIVGMMGVTATVAAPMAFSVSRFAHVRRSLQLAAGTLSVTFGLFLAGHIAVVDGLFTSAPIWLPR